MIASYYVGNHLGKVDGIKSTLDYMESVGAMEPIEEEDDRNKN